MKTITSTHLNQSRLAIMLTLFVFFLSFTTKAAVWTSAANGQWNAGATWTLVSGTPAFPYPTSGDAVTITTHSVNVPVTATCGSLVINAAGLLSFTAGQSLVVYGTFTNAGTITVTGTAVIYFSTSGTIPNPTVTQTGSMFGNYTIRFRPK